MGGVRQLGRRTSDSTSLSNCLTSRRHASGKGQNWVSPSASTVEPWCCCVPAAAEMMSATAGELINIGWGNSERQEAWQNPGWSFGCICVPTMRSASLRNYFPIDEQKAPVCTSFKTSLFLVLINMGQEQTCNGRRVKLSFPHFMISFL